MLKKEDFNNDTKDAGELGAGHTVTALYEIIPAGSEEQIPEIDNLKYQDTKIKAKAYKTNEIVTVKLRYKEPDGIRSKLIRMTVSDKKLSFQNTSNNFRFSAAVAQFGMLLRDSEFKGKSTYRDVLNLANSSRGRDLFGYRGEFIQLVKICKLLTETK